VAYTLSDYMKIIVFGWKNCYWDDLRSSP